MRYYHRVGKMRELFCKHLSRNAPSVSSLFDNAKGQKVMMSALFLIWFYGLHCGIAMKMSQKKNGVPWTQSYLRMNLNICQQGAAIFQAEAIRRNRVATSSTACVRNARTFVNVRKGLSHYAQCLLIIVQRLLCT